MTDLSLPAAQSIVAGALDHAVKAGFKPLAVLVLDARGALKAAAAQDGTSLKRADIAHGRTARVLFGIVSGEMILLEAFIKKSRATLTTELELARKRLKEVS